MYSITIWRLEIQISLGQGLKFSLTPMKKILLTQKLLTCLNWVLLNLLYILQMNTSPRCLCGKEKWQIYHDFESQKAQ